MKGTIKWKIISYNILKWIISPQDVMNDTFWNIQEVEIDQNKC